jgi:hypothetical protein
LVAELCVLYGFYHFYCFAASLFRSP